MEELYTYYYHLSISKKSLVRDKKIEKLQKMFKDNKLPINSIAEIDCYSADFMPCGCINYTIKDKKCPNNYYIYDFDAPESLVFQSQTQMSSTYKKCLKRLGIFDF